MAQLPNTPADNIDFNLLLQSFESLGLFDEHVVSYAYEIAVDYALPGPHPKHNLKTNFVTGHGLMIYREEDDPLWPERNRIMDCAFVPPVLPPGEVVVSPTLLPALNRNVTSSGPRLLTGNRGLVNISNVAILRGYVPLHPPNNPFRRIDPMLFNLGLHQNPFHGVEPYTLLYTEVCALNSLFLAVQNDTPTFPEFQLPELIMHQFRREYDGLMAAVNQANYARPFLGGPGNRGWYHIFNLALSPFMTRFSEGINSVVVGETMMEVFVDLVQGMTVAVLADDPRFEAAEERQLEAEAAEERQLEEDEAEES